VRYLNRTYRPLPTKTDILLRISARHAMIPKDETSRSRACYARSSIAAPEWIQSALSGPASDSETMPQPIEKARSGRGKWRFSDYWQTARRFERLNLIL
jgi:hypothetical protein